MTVGICIGLVLIIQTVTIADADLSPTVKEWVDITLSRQGETWDEATGMIGSSKGNSTRGTMFYALGLLQRGREEDTERACTAIRSVCKQQYVAPGMKYHGTFSRSDREQPPADGGDFDPNWREFIGLSMILALEQCGDSIDEITRQALLDALRNACEGAYERNVAWRYTNISLMSALLLSWGAKQFDTPEWKVRGEKLSRDIYENFSKNKTFSEYNSPTYNGVNLWALAAWRIIAPTPEMAAMGAEMEAGLWRDIARSYHAGLGNVCGPYDRSYGMDMGRYFAITGIAIALATQSPASMPDLSNNNHFHDRAYLPLLALLGLRVPEDAMAHLLSFQGERRYARIVERGSANRRAYSWLYDTYMVGVQTNARVRKATTQYHPLTVHWKGNNDIIHWIRFIGDTPAIISLLGDAIEIKPARKSVQTVLKLEVYAPGTASFTKESWNLPGMTIKTPVVPVNPEVTQKGNTFTVSYPIPEGDERNRLIIEVN